ncbi:hypothetical protein TrispH2_009866 [Trichoplax sp. H2]|nr:hypothetical protein TrispH2_009866 [Trichoplax sp. H2]|eukprot:RDD38115.1 hypothetical protein TrispH2_009866 [Trichoplax sp. H2]
MASKIEIEKYNFDQSLLAFERKSNAPEIICRVVQSFLKGLQQNSIVFHGDQTIKIAEIACGPGNRTIGYFKGIDFQPGYDIRATDINATFTGENGFNFSSCKGNEGTNAASVLGKNEKNLGLTVKAYLQAITTQSMPLKTFSIKRGNAFLENPLHLLVSRSDDIQSERSTFSLVNIFHCLYYVFNEKEPEEAFQRFFHSLKHDILADNGVALFCHSTLKPNSHIALEYKYAFQSIHDIHPTTQEYEKYSLDHIIEKNCQKNNLPCYKVEFLTKVHFTQALFDQQDIIRDIYRYDELDENAIDDIHRLLFIARRSPMELYKDKSDIGLNHLLDTVQAIVRNDGGILEHNALQVVLSQNASQQQKQAVECLLERLNTTPMQ